MVTGHLDEVTLSQVYRGVSGHREVRHTLVQSCQFPYLEEAGRESEDSFRKALNVIKLSKRKFYIVLLVRETLIISSVNTENLCYHSFVEYADTQCPICLLLAGKRK